MPQQTAYYWIEFSAHASGKAVTPLRIALAHDDSIANFEGHQVLTNLQRAAIRFARSRHDIINGCPRNLIVTEKY